GPGGRRLPVRTAARLAAAGGSRGRGGNAGGSAGHVRGTGAPVRPAAYGVGGDPLPVRAEGGIADARPATPARPRPADDGGGRRAARPGRTYPLLRCQPPAAAGLRQPTASGCDTGVLHSSRLIVSMSMRNRPRLWRSKRKRSRGRSATWTSFASAGSADV